jgi:dTDP-4-amino-4,6-dideoxygalactose transaminase
MRNAHSITREFEAALCEYTGAPYAVAVNSCTMALLLAVAWSTRDIPREHWAAGDPLPLPEVSIPKHTYVSVPQSIIHAGGLPVFRDEAWVGCYQLKPLPIWDSARWFSYAMFEGGRSPGIYRPKGWQALRDNANKYLCVSFHSSKILGDTQGGAILHDNAEADAWFRRARFDGRAEGVAPKDDNGIILGWHCYMSPDVSARLLNKLYFLPRHNEPMPNDDYPDLSQLECFK